MGVVLSTNHATAWVHHVLLSSSDFGYPAQHNYFETFHAKGEQDAAGAHIKQKASLAVVRREATTQSAEQLCSFTEPVSKESEKGVLLCEER